MSKQPINTSDNEIDLGLFLLTIAKIIKRNLRLILTFLFVGIALGLIYFFIKKPQYESTMIVSSKILTKVNATNLVESLQDLLEDANYELLAAQLNIDDSTAIKISRIMVEELDENAPKPNPEDPIFLKIGVSVFDTEILPELERGIVDFFENNQYVDQRVTLRRERYEALINEAQDEINQIDSLKNKVDAGLLLQSQGPNVVMMEPVNIYTASMDLFEKKQTYIENLELASGIHLVKGFTAFQKQTSPKLSISLIIGLTLGIVLAAVIVFLAELKAYLKKLNKKHFL